MAILMVVAYMFVKSLLDYNGHQPPSLLMRIAVVSIGPIVWNGAVFLVHFMFSLFLGPFLDTQFPKLGAVMAFIAHTLGTIGMIAFFGFFMSFATPLTV
jgi:1,3-beta-glucan synthase